MAEEKVKFKKPRPNFKVILERQKKMEDDEKFAISDSLQEYIDKVSKGAGYQNQDKLDKANIRQEVINFVDNYTIGDLDSIKGMEYDEALQLQNSTEKKIQEFEGLGVLNKQEIAFIKATVGETNKRLGEVLGVSTRLKFAFRDLKKELKPLKLAARLGVTRIPIIGKRIERAIRAEEEGESEALRIKRGLRKREARIGRKEGDSGALETPSELQQTETTAKQVTAGIMGIDSKPDLFSNKEQRVEEERESDTQFETTSNILEKILIESELTNELLGGKKKDKGGLLEGGGLTEGILATLGLQKFVKFIKGVKLAGLGTTLATFGGSIATFAGLLTSVFALPAFLAFLNRPQSEDELKEMKEQSRDYALTGEAATMDDYEAQDKGTQLAIDKGERKKLIERGDIDNSVTLEEYSKAKKEADVGPRITSLWSGKIKDNEVERVLQVLSNGSTTNQGDMISNSSSTDLSSVTTTTETKLDKANQITSAGVDKSTTAVDTGSPIVVNNQVNDNSNTQNKTEYGSTTIGTQNPNDLTKSLSNIG
jgi:hypothetical protein